MMMTFRLDAASIAVLTPLARAKKRSTSQLIREAIRSSAEAGTTDGRAAPAWGG